VQRSAGDGARRAGRRSLITFLGGVGLVAVALLASMTNVVPDLITTVAAIVGVAAMVYGVATGTLIVLNREPDE
jgi:hypothetical protein